MDKMVLEVQKWLNETYAGKIGYTTIPEDGKTGNTTVNALIIGLQIEIGIAFPVPNFGPSTKEKFPGLSRQSKNEPPTNLNKILQGGFWCKGYNPGGFTGNFFGETENKVKEFEINVGLDPTGYVDAKLMEAILNTDGFDLKDQQPSYIRTMQQLLNRDYNNYFAYIPTNGVYERKTNKAIIYALQHEIGIGDIANGNYGPSTQANTPTLKPGNENRKLNRVLQFALAANGYYQTGLYDGYYRSAVESAVRDFQVFMTLPSTGVAAMPTIKQLLTSNGWIGRTTSACDASTIVDRAKAQTLVNHGYNIIGRYLTGTVGGTRSKAMTHEELEILEEYGIRVFPIYQNGGYYSEYFNYERGFSDGFRAINAAERLGFPYNTTIYFAVDFDAYDFQVTNLILPYLKGVRKALDSTANNSGLNKYNLGVYGPRNICIRASGDIKVNAKYSFVANMSTGFSGNLGYPMPRNWAFSQYHEYTISSSGNDIRVDKNDYSGKDTGVRNVEPPSPDTIRQKLYDEMMNIGRSLPGFFINPDVFGTTFSFNQKFPVFESLFYNIFIETQTNYSLGGENATYITVSNGEIGYDLKDLINSEQYFGKLSASRKKEYEDRLSGLSATIGNGYIEFTAYMDGMKNVTKITAYKDDIQSKGQKLSLAVSVIFEVIPLNAPSPEFNRLRDATLIVSAPFAVLGGTRALQIIASTFRLGGPIGFVASTIALLILGEKEEMEVEE
ncbi:DUF1906 domain-containing protein [Virgibacillus halodenitrificans]|uniref:DUF1906 domain-containing protein n=2 Tax=Virgibacillus halodenitrificans TaxID=1482 RepID=A0ABR7VHW2_VIRHA|nr:DUF1906 domain-containing protein [Virgibacillus halodenitrificans]